MEWKAIKSVRGYEVNNVGKVRSKLRMILNNGKIYFHKPRILRTYNEEGYKFVRLSKFGKVKKYYIHKLVAEAFIGPNPDPENLTIDHKNRIRDDNRPENLRYASKEEQTENRKLDIKYGEKSNFSKLTWDKVEKIRDSYNKGQSIKHLSVEFKVSNTTISRIIKNKIWKPDSKE